MHELLAERLGARYHYVVPQLRGRLQEWGGRLIQRGLPADQIGGYTVHHSDSEGLVGLDGALSVTWRYHIKTKGWDTGGYNALIDREGNLYLVTHPLEHMTYSTGAPLNPHRIAVCCVGHFHDVERNGKIWKAEQPTPAMLGTLYVWLQSLSLAIGPRAWRGHREDKPTACPGDQLFEHVVRMRGPRGHELYDSMA